MNRGSTQYKMFAEMILSSLHYLGHLQRADASRPRACEYVRSVRRAGFTRSSGATHPDRRVRPVASVHQIWVTDASARIGALSAHVLPRGTRPGMAATQRAKVMLVKGWSRRLTFCTAVTPQLL
jgi:hypothetical protein